MWKYGRTLGIGVCVLCTAMTIENTALASNTSDVKALTAGAGTVLNVKGEVSDVLLKVGAASVMDDYSEEVLWGYSNLGIAKVENHLNVRSVPADDGKLVGKLSTDAACEILGFEGDWAHIKSGKVEGYVHEDYLLMGSRAKARAAEIVKPLATVTSNALKVREKPSTESPVITTVPNGEEMEVVREKDGWVEVMLDDESAYISSEFVSVEEKLNTAVTMSELLYGNGVSNVRVDLAQYAKQFVGNRYVWGGTSLTKGADCSGFVLSVFRKYGISLPHSSVAQAGYGSKINASQAQPGDLFFYAKGGRINHVAIYIGNGQVVHASSPSTGIRISNATYRNPVAVRRLLP